MLQTRNLVYVPGPPFEHPICNGTQTSYDELSKVNPLYGIGTITGWYLTALGLLITWIFHPEKRWRNAISVDLIVVITLPLVAAGHLTHSMWHQLSWRLQNDDGGDVRWDMARRADQFAAFAPFTILRDFQVWSTVVLLNPVLFLYGVKRALLIYATVLIANYIQLMYAHMFSLGIASLFENPDGVEPVEGNWTMAIMYYGVVMFCPIAGAIIVYSKCCIDLGNPEDTDAESLVGMSIYLVVFWTDFLFLLMYLKGSRPTIVSAQHCPDQHRSALRLFLFPDSNSSYGDLDQAVAAGAGATTLLTRVFSVCVELYKRWRSRRERRALLKIDPSAEDQPVYTDDADEGQGTTEDYIDHYSSQDIELSTIRPLPQPGAIHQQTSSEPESSEPRTDCLMSGALATDSEDDDEPDAPIPLVASQNRSPRTSRHVTFTDELIINREELGIIKRSIRT